MPRSFRVAEGRTLTLPKDLDPTMPRLGDGFDEDGNARARTFTVADARAVANGRFLAGRVAAGDIVEIDAASADTTPAPRAKAKTGRDVALAMHTEK